jgi:hypothetical protein
MVATKSIWRGVIAISESSQVIQILAGWDDLRVKIGWERYGKKIKSGDVALRGEKFISGIVLSLVIYVSSPIVTSNDDDWAVFKSFQGGIPLKFYIASVDFFLLIISNLYKGCGWPSPCCHGSRFRPLAWVVVTRVEESHGLATILIFVRID